MTSWSFAAGGQLSFQLSDRLIALDQFLPQFFVLAVQPLVLTLEVLRFYRLLSARLAMRCPQTSTLPGFSTSIQV
jgi:hypothetical protein